ncbi:amino acid adenylation domain-containing protein [Cytobacillus sp. FSL H8-0458]|uniref:amino acid adenylation domain-containing protein n=1 Tax=Cytobacillus sp. FSL H8-0458 TaxID=2975346 RepID=UPI0030F9FA67
MDIKCFLNDLKKLNISIYQNQGKIKIIGPRDLITNEVKQRIKGHKEQIIAFLEREDIKRNGEITKVIPTKNGCYPMSLSQKRMVILHELETEGTTYNIPLVMKLNGDVQLTNIENAFKMLIKRHEILRTSFVKVNGETVQKVEQNVDFEIGYGESAEADVPARIESFIRPFNLEKAPLLRVDLLKINEDEHILMLDMHHIISDGMSMIIMMKELSDICNGIELCPLEIHYKEYSEWQKTQYEEKKILKQEEFWLNLFKGEIPVLNLPTDYQRPQTQSNKGDSLVFEIEADLMQQLKALARKNGVTMYMLLLAAYTILLSKHTGQEDIIIGTPVSGRSRTEFKNVIGMFINTLAMRNNPRANISFTDYLKEVRVNTLGAYDNQDYQFDSLVEKLEINSDKSRNPLFDTMFDIQTYSDFSFNIDGVSTEVYDFNLNIAKFDLSLTAIEYPDHISLDLQYCTKLFKRESIKRLAGHFVNLLVSVVNDPAQQLKEINILSKEEKQLLLHKFNDTKVELPKTLNLTELFEKQVEKSPNHTALIFEEKHITYLELNEKANQLAKILRSKGVGKDIITAVIAEKSIEMIVGILAVLKAGGAYLPIDPEYPADRIQHILQDSKVKIIVSQDHIINRFETAIERISFEDKSISKQSKDNLPYINDSSDLAYIIYTSGSTGKPKGVMTTHQNVVNYIHAFSKVIPLNEEDTILQVASFSFDAFTEEIFPILLSSGKIVISPNLKEMNIDRLVNLINLHNVTLVSCSPLLLNEIDKNEHLILNNKMKFISGGDVLKYEYIKNIIKYADVYNSYGPTEATVCATYYKVSPEDLIKTSIPIGKPISNYKVNILDEHFQLLPIGVAGELYIGGKGVARGYQNNNEMTESKFVMDKWNPEEKLYRTGDLARWLPDGNIEFLGRIDNQVKIRGFRIELDEIEYYLLQHKNIKEAKVAVIEGNNNSRYLCAYLTMTGIQENIEKIELREALLKELPEYMVPSHFIQLKKMPLTINGKINLKALPKPDLTKKIEEIYQEPQNEIEKKLLAIWEEILGIKKIGVIHNFFEAGGDSLKAFSLASQIYKQLGVEIPLKQIFTSPTIKGISEWINRQETSIYSTIKQTEEKGYYSLSSAQKRLYILNEIEGRNSTTYNLPFVLKIRGPLNVKEFENTFRKLINRHEGLRTAFVIQNGEPVQKILKDAEFKINISFWDELSLTNKVSQFIKPFNLEEAPLLRVEIIRIDPEEHIMLFDMHHIISDGISIEILMKELADYYNGNPLPPLKIQYKDYSEWQKELYTNGNIKKQEGYWLNVFKDEIPVLNMPTDYPRPQIQRNEGHRLGFTLEPELTHKLKVLAKEKEVTMYMLLLGAYTALLSKYTGQEDIIVGSPIAGRHHEDLKNVVGMFVNTLAMRNYPRQGIRFTDFLKEIRENTLNAYDNQDYQFDELIERLNLQRDISRNALFDTMFSTHSATGTSFDISGLTFEPINIDFNIAKFDLSLSAIEYTDLIKFDLEYCTKLFKESTMERLADHFKNLLQAIVNDPNQKLRELNILSVEEKNTLLNGFNNTQTPFPVSTIHTIFENEAENNPDSAAAVFGENEISYKELNEKANRLARTLRNKGITRGSIVGIMVDRSLNMVAGILGILKAGGAYLPIDPDYPRERIDFMLNDSLADIILTQGHYIRKMNFRQEAINIEDLDIYHEDGTNLNTISLSSDLAYVIYTSGTSGTPKGVMVEHQNIINAHYAWRYHYGLSKFKVRLLQLASMSFDVFTGDLCRSLLNGGTMYIVSNQTKLDMELLHEVIMKHKINIFESTPGLIIPLMNYIHDKKLEISSLKLLILGSDICPVNEYKKLNELFGEKMRIVNSYGVTEAAVDSSYYEESYDRLPQITNTPIGKPLNNTRFYVLSSSLTPQPLGVYGELYIGGKGVARGYLNNPSLTRERFLDDCFNTGQKMYKTGDMARWLPDGNMEFLGRADDQVKIRGYRIETGEIESHLLQYSNIKQALVIVRNNKNNIPNLYAYFTAKSNITASQLRSFLTKYLPDYMIPSYFIQLDVFPLTPNGKIDRKALPIVESNSYIASESYEPPRNHVEEQLVAAWEDVLGISGIGINKSFFEIGGDSIKALQIVSRLSKKGLRLKIRDLFANPKIKNLSKYIVSEIKPSNEHEIIEGRIPLTPIQKRYFDINNTEFDHYNQSLILFRKDGFNENIVEAVFTKITEQHDALRIVFKEENGEFIQFNRGLNEKVFDLIVRDISNEQDTETLVQQTAAELQKEISITDEKLVKLCIFKTHQGDHLLMVVHHLIIDGVSWRILIEDLQTAYNQVLNGEKIDLGFKTSSYMEFSRKLAEYADSKQLNKELKYWEKISSEKAPFLPKIQEEISNDYENSKTFRTSLNEEFTAKLLAEANQAYNTQINDLLLTALLVTVRDLTSENKMKVLMEGHGREEVIQRIDLSRTIGWFTSLYPVYLNLNDERDLSKSIKIVKETLRKVPNNGIGYGILKYLAKSDILFEDEAPILFNYLGEIDSDITNDEFSSSWLPTGANIGDSSARDASIEIDSIVAEGKLFISTTFNYKEYSESLIETFNKTYKSHLEQIIHHCVNKSDSEKTSSDYGSDLSLDDLEELLNEYEFADS